MENSFSIDGEDGLANLSSQGLSINFLARPNAKRWRFNGCWIHSKVYFLGTPVLWNSTLLYYISLLSGRKSNQCKERQWQRLSSWAINYLCKKDWHKFFCRNLEIAFEDILTVKRRWEKKQSVLISKGKETKDKLLLFTASRIKLREGMTFANKGGGA